MLIYACQGNITERTFYGDIAIPVFIDFLQYFFQLLVVYFLPRNRKHFTYLVSTYCSTETWQKSQLESIVHEAIVRLILMCVFEV